MKRIFFILAILIFSLFSLYPKIAHAAKLQPSEMTAKTLVPDRPTANEGLKQDINSNSISKNGFDSASLNNLIVFFGNNLIEDEKIAQLTGSQGGAAGAMAGMIAGIIGNPAVSTPTYIADITSRMGLVTPAYAQDQSTGWTALKSILVIWKAFRNIAYLGFVIIFVIVGFMVMFRAQINPQTVVTVQAALPKIVLTLLLVTFSYAIASLMIDLIYVLLYLIINVFGTFGVISNPGQLIKDFLGKNLIYFARQILNVFSGNSPAGAASAAIGNIVNDIVGNNLVGWAAHLFSEPIAYVIIAFAIVIALFKLLLQLLMAYIGIIFTVIFSPIILLFNALPNSNTFATWLKGLFANIIVFPATAILFILAGALAGSKSFYISPGVGFQNTNQAIILPLIGGGFDTDAIQAIIGIGCIMIMPKIIELIQEMMGIKGGFAGMAAAAFQPVAESSHKLFAASPAEQYTQKGWLRRAPIPGTSRISSKTPGGITPPSFLDFGGKK